MINYWHNSVIDMKKAKKYLTEWHIENLRKAISRNPDSPHNVDREIEIKELLKKIEDNYEE